MRIEHTIGQHENTYEANGVVPIGKTVSKFKIILASTAEQVVYRNTGM